MFWIRIIFPESDPSWYDDMDPVSKIQPKLWEIMGMLSSFKLNLFIQLFNFLEKKNISRSLWVFRKLSYVQVKKKIQMKTFELVNLREYKFKFQLKGQIRISLFYESADPDSYQN